MSEFSDCNWEITVDQVIESFNLSLGLPASARATAGTERAPRSASSGSSCCGSSSSRPHLFRPSRTSSSSSSSSGS